MPCMKRIKYISAFCILFYTCLSLKGQVGIGTTTPDASSILDLSSTTKGMLIPRMTTAQRNAIGTPVSGLMIYNTSTSAFNFYTGSAWTTLFSGSSGVNSITGTANRITLGGTTSDPIVDISSSYVGQNSITTLGTIGTGTWNGTLIGTPYGGTGTTTTFTPGSIVFAGASGAYTQDNTKLFWDDTNNRLGIGTASPTSHLHIAAGTATASTAPLKFTAGTNLTTPESGAVEYDGTHLYATIGSTRYQLDQQNTLKATYQATPADPASTTSTSGVMMGISGSITPANTGRVMIIISGDLKNGTNNGNTTVQIRYGTGAAPTNGNALTGTSLGGQINMTAASANQRVPFSCNSIVTLTVGTTYWIDLALKAVSGTAYTQNLSISITEL